MQKFLASKYLSMLENYVEILSFIIVNFFHYYQGVLILIFHFSMASP